MPREIIQQEGCFSTVGKLRYITTTRPDIVNFICRYQDAPQQALHSRSFGYLKKFPLSWPCKPRAQRLQTALESLIFLFLGPFLSANNHTKKRTPMSQELPCRHELRRPRTKLPPSLLPWITIMNLFSDLLSIVLLKHHTSHQDLDAHYHYVQELNVTKIIKQNGLKENLMSLTSLLDLKFYWRTRSRTCVTPLRPRSFFPSCCRT